MGRPALALAIACAAFATAAGASATTRPRPIQFGRSGGNGPQWAVSIRSDGTVVVASPGRGTSHRKISSTRVRRLGREIQRVHLPQKRICAGSNPDFTSQYIKFGGHTFILRGSCEPRFTRVWNDLARAVGTLPT